MIKTAPMKPGTKIGIVALAGPMEAKTLLAGEAYLISLGYEVLIAPSCFESHLYLAGDSDESRALDLMMMFADDEIGLILNMRGGYGSNRIIPYLTDFNFSLYPKPFVGYSDITYVHLYLNQFHQLVTYHGPMIKDFLTKNVTTLSSFQDVAVEGDLFDLSDVEYLNVGDGPIEGELIGGNLSIVVSTLGTPYEIDTTGKILFLEDIDESPYSVDRMLCQLIYAGKMNDCIGIVLGDFNSGEETEEVYFTIEQILRHVDKSIAWKIKAGHCTPNLTLPLGATYGMDGLARRLFVVE